MSEHLPRRYLFGEFEVDAVSRELRRNGGAQVSLTPKVFDTLLLLVQNAGSVLGKEAMIAAIWPKRIVEENNLTQNISVLRRVLGASAGDHRYIVTEPGQGYRFVAPVRIETGEGNAAAGAEQRASSSSGMQRTRKVLLLAIAALAIVGAAAWLWRARALPSAAASIPTLAVLPFKPLLPDSRDEVLELGMADTLIAKLSTDSHVVVRSLSAVRRFGLADQDPVAAGRALGVASVLEGHIQRQGDQVRLNARLLAVPGGAALWSGTFDASFTDVFAVQDAITQQVAAALSLQLDRDQRRRMAENYTRNVEAYQLYLHGRFHLQKATPPELETGIDFFRQALVLDPSYALAYVGLAEGYRRQAIISDADPQTVLPLAKAAAQHALKIDDTLAEAYVPLGFVSFWYDWDWAAAETEFKRGIELQPSFADAHFGYAALLSNTGRHADALHESERARALDPLSPLYVALEASFVGYAGHVEEARQQVEGVLRSNPDFWIAHLVRGWLDTDAQRYDEAVADFTRARDLSGGSQQAVSMLGYALGRAGRQDDARAILDSLLARAAPEYLAPTSIATIHVGLGENEQALDWLERGYAARDVRMTFLKVDRRWDPLRDEPRFVAIVRRMRLE